MKFTTASRIASAIGAVILSAIPLFAFAQTTLTPPTNLQTLFTFILGVINLVVPVLFAIAFVVFLFGIYRYFIQGGGNAEKAAEGRKFVMWAIIGFFVMFSVWGIINLFLTTFGFNNASQPGIPTFSATGGGGGGTTQNGFPSSNGGATTASPTNGTIETCSTNGSCPANCTPNGDGTCTVGGSGSGAGSASGLGIGGDCENNPGACQSDLICASNPNGDDTCETAADSTGFIACDDGSQVPVGSQCVQCPGTDAGTSADLSLCPSN